MKSFPVSAYFYKTNNNIHKNNHILILSIHIKTIKSIYSNSKVRPQKYLGAISTDSSINNSPDHPDRSYSSRELRSPRLSLLLSENLQLNRRGKAGLECLKKRVGTPPDS